MLKGSSVSFKKLSTSILLIILFILPYVIICDIGLGVLNGFSSGDPGYEREEAKIFSDCSPQI